MRKALSKIKSSQHRVFVGTIKKIAYEKYMIANIQMYDESGTQVIGKINHCLVAKKPFHNCSIGDKVRFTGTVKSYIRQDGSKDFGIVVNKAKKVVDK